MTPAALARLRWAAEQPPPPVPAGQLALIDPAGHTQPRPVVPAGPPEPLFDAAEVVQPCR
jgi:hypothetical protein